MTENAGPARAARTYAWWLVLCLVGLDYFSTLAYLPSIAIEAGSSLAPLAALAVVAVTLLLALPVYAYVVGRSPQGEGATGLLERHVHGWLGKVLILVLLGFVSCRNTSATRRSRPWAYLPPARTQACPPVSRDG